MGKKFLAQLKSLKISKGLVSLGGGKKIQKLINVPSCIKHPRVSISLCLTPVIPVSFDDSTGNTVCNMTGQFKTLVFKYYCEMNIYYLIVKFMASVAVNSMFKCKEFNLAKVSGIIFQLQDSSQAGT